MSSTHAPKHRSTPADRSPRRTTAHAGRKRAAVLAAVALGATGLAVSGGLLADHSPVRGGAAAALSASPAVQQHLSQADLAAREDRVSRSSDRTPVTDRAKARTLSNASGPARTSTEDLSSADPKSLTKALMPQFGMSPSDFSCIDAIWTQESGWNVHAANPTSSAYGIPQALPGSKMSSAGPDWANNPMTQIKWGLGYIKSRYGSACAAAGFKSANGWY